MWFFLILGAIVFLIMEHSVVFWVVFVPLILFFLASLAGFFKKGGTSGVKDFIAAMVILVVMIVVLMIVCIP